MADTQVVRSRGLETMTDSAEAAKTADALVRSAIGDLTKDFKVPSFEGIDSTELKADTERARTTRETTNKVIDTETSNANAAAAKQKEALAKEGNASAESVLADADRAKQESDLYNYFGALFGVSTDPSAQIARDAEKATALRPVAEAKLRSIQEKQKVGMLDDFGGWLVNQFTLPGEIADYNAEANVINSLEDSIQKGISSAQNAASFAARGIPTITASKAKAEADKARAASEVKIAIVDENLASKNISFAVQKLANDLNIANATDRMTSVDLQNKKQEYESQIAAINLAENHAKRLLSAAQLMEKLQDTKGLDVLLENYDRIMGHPKGTTTRYTFEKFSEPQRQNMVAIGAGSLGADPFEGMLNWFKSRPGPGASAETKRFMDYLRDRSEEIAVTEQVQRLDEKQKPAAISKRLKDKLNEEFEGASRQGSIFYEMTPAQMLASGSIPKESNLYRVLEPLSKTPGTVPTSAILETINREYKNPIEAGAVISDYYNRNIKLRNSVMNTSIAGVTLPKDYKIRESMIVEPTLGAGARMSFDVTRPEEATKYILLKRASDIVRASGSMQIGQP